MEDTRHGLGADFVAAPAQQGAVVGLYGGRVGGDAAATCRHRLEAIDGATLDSGVVECPTEPPHRGVAVHLAADRQLLQPRRAVHSLLTGVALRPDYNRQGMLGLQNT